MKIDWKLAAAGIISAAGGGVIGYVVAAKRLEKIWAQRVQDEVAFAKDFYKKVYKVGDFETPESATETLGLELPVDRARQALTIYQRGTPEDMAALKGTIVKPVTYHPDVPPSNAFDAVTPQDLGEATLPFDSSKPYAISPGDFAGGGEEYLQLTYTWYMGDGVLAGEDDEKIENVDDVVGLRNLVFEGPDPIYIRNETRMTEYEIVASTGRYDVEVLGHSFDPE